MFLVEHYTNPPNYNHDAFFYMGSWRASLPQRIVASIRRSFAKRLPPDEAMDHLMDDITELDLAEDHQLSLTAAALQEFYGECEGFFT